MRTASAKERAIAALRDLADDVSVDEVIEPLNFIAAVEEGLRQSTNGELIPHDEIVRRFHS